MTTKCKNCLCYKCENKFGTIPLECPLSDCPWCSEANNTSAIEACNGYLEKGGTYGKKPKEANK